MLLDPGMNLTLRPMKYPAFYEMYRNAIKNTWTVDEVDLYQDLTDWSKLNKQEQHFIKYVLAFFAASDGIVLENLTQQFCS